MSQQAILAMVKGAYIPTPMILDPLKGVGYSQDAFLTFDEQRTFASLEVVTNLPRGRIERITMEKGGREFINWPVEVLEKRDGYLGNPTDVDGQTRFYLDFADETLRTQQGIRRGELVMLAGEQFKLKIRIASKQTGDPSVIEMMVRARELPAQQDRFFLPRLEELIIDQTVAGEQRHKFPMMGADLRIRRIFLQSDNDDIDSLTLKRDGNILLETDTDDYNSDLERYYAMTPQDGYQALDFIAHGFAAESSFVPVANQSLQLFINKKTAGTIRVYVEYLVHEKQVPTS
ncbi:major capsid protein P2 [Vibrio crassostreae]|uniref:major capsid protein P2 n=1 Tax=Vibrio crassostreae TaxID=246167 RepID=UPI0010505B41|nr:major capsid protein P2 [Vibrio crassostreae]TCT60145.1 hypothetical protein EDB31_15413 [Vibrio crassostreae]